MKKAGRPRLFKRAMSGSIDVAYPSPVLAEIKRLAKSEGIKPSTFIRNIVLTYLNARDKT